MRTIGVRELRQQASDHLRRVENGETIEVTDRGRPVALLVPVPVTTSLARLVAAGRVDVAEGDLLELGAPLKPAPGTRLPSAILAETRAQER